MSERNVSIALLMKLTALAAVNLGLFVFADMRPMVSPLETAPGFFIVAALNLVIVQSVILGRPLGAFHFTFLVVGTLASIVVTFLTIGLTRGRSEWSLGILESLNASHLLGEYLPFADRLLTSALGVLAAWGAAEFVAGRARQRRNRPGPWARWVAAVFQGAVIGLGVLTLGPAVRYGLFDPASRGAGSAEQYAIWFLLAACPILGGVFVCYASRTRPE
jgi:hypothetical protein